MITKKIIEIMEEVLKDKIESSTLQSNCENWDSLNHLNLIIRLESDFGISFEPEEIGVMTSVETIKLLVRDKLDV